MGAGAGEAVLLCGVAAFWPRVEARDAAAWPQRGGGGGSVVVNAAQCATFTQLSPSITHDHTPVVTCRPIC